MSILSVVIIVYTCNVLHVYAWIHDVYPINFKESSKGMFH